MQARHSPSREWARAAHGGPGVELLEAAFDHHVYDRHSHDTLAVGVTLRGVQRFWCRGSTHDSRPGDVIVLDPGEVHDGRSGAPGGYAYRMLYIDADLVRAVVEDAEQRPSRDLISDFPLIHNPGLAREIHAAWIARAASPVSLEASERLERIVRSIALRNVQPREDRPVLWQDAVRRVRDYRHDHIGDPITTTDLARVANVSRFQLTRQFQRMFGLPLHAYHLQVRLEEAKRRMAHGQTIVDVASALGFVDQSHFHRRFRAHFGLTPAEWRRTAIQDA